MKRFFAWVVVFLFACSNAFAILCARCGLNNEDTSFYCTRCGAPLAPAQEAAFCPRCGGDNPYDATFCTRCGLELRRVVPGPGYAYPQPAPAPAPGPGYSDVGIFIHKEREPHHHQPKQPGWRLVGTVSAIDDDKGKGVNLPGAGPIRRIKFRGVSGNLIINTLTVREGRGSQRYPITSRFAPGHEVVKELGREMNSTEFGISRKGTGSVEVYVQ